MHVGVGSAAATPTRATRTMSRVETLENMIQSVPTSPLLYFQWLTSFQNTLHVSHTHVADSVDLMPANVIFSNGSYEIVRDFTSRGPPVSSCLIIGTPRVICASVIDLRFPTKRVSNYYINLTLFQRPLKLRVKDTSTSS